MAIWCGRCREFCGNSMKTDARVAVLLGNGKAFSTGADVKARQCRSREEFERFGGPQEPDAHSGDLFTRSVRWKPVIAAPHGYVMGLSVGIVLECELVLAEAGTQFQITETPRGLGGASQGGCDAENSFLAECPDVRGTRQAWRH